MRDEFSDSINSFSKNKNLIFLTGDLGFNALENLAASMGDRFINGWMYSRCFVDCCGLALGLIHLDFTRSDEEDFEARFER